MFESTFEKLLRFNKKRKELGKSLKRNKNIYLEKTLCFRRLYVDLSGWSRGCMKLMSQEPYYEVREKRFVRKKNILKFQKKKQDQWGQYIWPELSPGEWEPWTEPPRDFQSHLLSLPYLLEYLINAEVRIFCSLVDWLTD